jgi:DNA-binding ferritin-like protein
MTPTTPQHEEILNKHVDAMAERLAEVELEMFRLAGKRMKKISGMGKEELEQYLYSAELYQEMGADTKKIEKLLKKANAANEADIERLFEKISQNLYEEAVL